MPYQYLDDATTADVAFEASGETLRELLLAAWEATVGLMIENPELLHGNEIRRLELGNDDPEMLLFDLLGELLFYKDAEGVLLTLPDLSLQETEGCYRVEANARGARIDPERHALGVDIKAVTLHQFRLTKSAEGWNARVVLDT